MTELIVVGLKKDMYRVGGAQHAPGHEQHLDGGPE
jgi:hypothetical protein